MSAYILSGSLAIQRGPVRRPSVDEPKAKLMIKKSSKRSRSEPEIILPGNQPDTGIWASKTADGTHRIHVTRFGPFEINPFAVAIGAVLILAVLLLLGFFLIWILPLIVTLIVIAVVIRFARQIFTENK
jgi:hypothetical protein